MKCLYCDSQVRNNHQSDRCPNCGAPLLADEKSTACLEDYYYRHRPNRVKAAVALQSDTGMSPIKASRLINQIFDSYAKPIARTLRFRK